MPRETKEQRIQREQEELRIQDEKNKQVYFPRLIQALEHATNLYWEIEVKDNVFHIHDRNNEDSYIAPVHYDSASHWMLQALESAIEIEYVMIENRKRESELKINALNKLTEEERRVLGLV